MDQIALASVQDTNRRLRLAGDEFWDMRCVMHRGVDKIGMGDFNEGYGPTFRQSAFRVSDLTSFWKLFHYSQHDKPKSAFRRKRNRPWEITDEQQRREDHFNIRRESLLRDAYWVARGIGLSKIPGLDGIDTSKLYSGDDVWIWLVFHAAWTKPTGSVLRATKFIPAGLLTDVLLREKRETAVGFPLGSKRGANHYAEAHKAVQERTKQLSQMEKLGEWDEAAYEAEQLAMKLLKEDAYVSELPMDIFTASAALLDIMAADTAPGESPTPPPPPPPIVLNGQGNSVYVNGQEKPSLTDPQYNVLASLLEAGPHGLNKDELVKNSCHTDAVKILKRIVAIHDDWKSVIRLAGKPGGRYRVNGECSSPY
jgi:hypothetical protein